ncbi:MAG: cyclic pyranopterin monophosphate synthase MoaC [Methanotrichaceae archaeon]|nr:cyclic pyranopterin monophosphate synthase MoaC [Methanotrichaceae archaeon]
MVDITEKPPVRREASARGEIKLLPSTVKAIREMQVAKGDALATAEVAALLAVKDTPRIIPMCHNIPITGVDVTLELDRELVRATVTVRSLGRTGVEMEALTGVAAALLTVWDMVKSLEKDETGNYPETEILGIKVVEKKKEG